MARLIRNTYFEQDKQVLAVLTAARIYYPELFTKKDFYYALAREETWEFFYQMFQDSYRHDLVDCIESWNTDIYENFWINEGNIKFIDTTDKQFAQMVFLLTRYPTQPGCVGWERMAFLYLGFTSEDQVFLRKGQYPPRFRTPVDIVYL